MSHLALYRQFRPQTFEEIVGQEDITVTLKNQIKSRQIGHAYLFCGTRGTGKTTAAKVFAKAINCLDSVDGNPCGKCQNCTNQNNVDVIELDAASNNGVDYIRDIKEKVCYTPVNGGYKVYIIDEVHMLSQSAFNAFLKTLEEPPSHAVFILCTTEPQKIPQTILSRCLRFDFKLVSTDDLNGLLTNIFEKIGKEATFEAINAISVAGEGSVRDALSIADRCVSFAGDKKLVYDDVLELIGAADFSVVEDIANDILNQNTGGCLEKIQKVTKAGKNVTVLARDLAMYFRNMMVAACTADGNKILNLPSERYKKLKITADIANKNKLLFALELFAKSDNDLRFALNPKILFEALVLRAASCTGQADIDGMDMRISRLEKKVEQFLAGAPSGQVAEIAKTTDSAEQTNQNTDQQQNLSERKSIIKEYQKANIVWGKTLTALRSKGEDVLFAACEQVEQVWSEEDKFLILTAGEGALALLTTPDNAKMLQSIVSEFSSFVVQPRKQKPNDNDQQVTSRFTALAGSAPLTIDGKKIN